MRTLSLRVKILLSVDVIIFIVLGASTIVYINNLRRDYIEALSQYHLAAGTPTKGADLLPEIPELERFKGFCKGSWSESMKLVDQARRRQEERNRRNQTEQDSL